ncbi:MAG TPA: outer membrane protein transport protein [Polyangia bacterium]
MKRTAWVVMVGGMAAALLQPATARGAGFELAEQSALAAGTGGAGAAREGDPGAVWYNPAAIADGGGFRAGVSLFLALPQITANPTNTSFAPPKATTNELGVATPFAAHLAYARGRFGAGLYVGTSHGATVTWPAGWWGRFDATSTSLLVLRTAPSLSMRFGERGQFRIGAGAHIDYANLDLRRDLDFVDTTGNTNMQMSGTSAGGDASIFWEATPALSLGLTYQSRTVLHLAGNANFSVPPSFTGRAQDQGITSSITLPDRIALGSAWYRGRMALYADATLTLWSVNDTQTIHFSQGTMADVTQAQHWHESFSVRAGAETAVSRTLSLRGGAYYDHMAAPSDTLSASSPDAARVGLTIGGTLRLPRGVCIDSFGAVAILLPREATGPDAIPATYSGYVLYAGLAVRAGHQR